MNILRSAIVIAGLGIVGICILLFAGPRDDATGQTEATVMQKAGSLSAGGLTLTSMHMELPGDNEPYPSGPHADTVNANCLACHSASMVLYQPSLPAAEWRKEVEKMRDAYGAPVADADIPAIVAYLSGMQGNRKK